MTLYTILYHLCNWKNVKNTHGGYLELQAKTCIFIKRIPSQVFSCEFYEIIKNILLTKHLKTTPVIMITKKMKNIFNFSCYPCCPATLTLSLPFLRNRRRTEFFNAYKKVYIGRKYIWIFVTIFILLNTVYSPNDSFINFAFIKLLETLSKLVLEIK